RHRPSRTSRSVSVRPNVGTTTESRMLSTWCGERRDQLGDPRRGSAIDRPALRYDQPLPGAHILRTIANVRRDRVDERCHITRQPYATTLRDRLVMRGEMRVQAQ